MAGQTSDKSGASKKDQSMLIQAPALSLPKGGGAIHGMGEKFSANPVTGTGSTTIPIATSPGRNGFGPRLSLSYDSGAGNSVFGLGWNLGQVSISRKTDKGLPQYLDNDESDVFLYSGFEDLVPILDRATGNRKPPEKLTLNNLIYKVYGYRPRIEGSFALIERWVNENDSTDCFWRIISKDNVTTWFGRSDLSRISNPSSKAKIFQWLLDETHDDKGNVVVYTYVAEDSTDANKGTYESNRTDLSRSSNRYLKRIQYGNTVSRLNTGSWANNQWMFEVVLDYSDHSEFSYNADKAWPIRIDPFSTYRSGFEIRTYRLCKRVLMFHHFTELGGNPYLVKSTNFNYQLGDSNDPEKPGYTQLKSVTHHSYEWVSNQYESRQLPPLSFTYTQPRINNTLETINSSQLENLPVGTQGSGYQWVDLDGEGLSGVLSEQGGAWHYKPNHGDGKFGQSKVVATQPAFAALSSGRQQLMDLAGNGAVDLVDFSGPTPGFHERTYDDNWKSFVPFISLPNIDWNDQNLRFLDLTGDGHADALITEYDVFTWYPSLDEIGFDQSQQVRQSRDEEAGPKLLFADGTQTIFLADMCGDGLTDIVRIRNGEVCYWPNIGYGNFGKKVTLDNSPIFDHPDMYDPHRIRLADIDGSGPIDIIYLGRNGASLYFNRSGNCLSNAFSINLPVATENLGAAQVADLLGIGTACLVWSSHLPADTTHPVRFINLMAEGKPHLLIETDNNLGAITVVEYTPSTKFYIQDKLAGTPWITKLPFPVHCVSKVTVKDQWRGTEFSSQYSYHHGYFDGAEREFRGFGRVEQVDIEDYGKFLKGNIASPYITDDKKLFQPPTKIITWYHTGALLDRKRILDQFKAEYFPEKYQNLLNQSTFIEKVLSEPELPPNLTAEEWREALRACKGMVLRQESYELDVDELVKQVDKPVRIYTAAMHNCNIQLIQKRGENKHAVFLVTECEALSYSYELDLLKTQLKPDPRISHTLNLRYDEYGSPQQSLAITYGRVTLGQHDELPNVGPAVTSLIDDVQKTTHIAYSEIHYTQDVILKAKGQAATAPIKHYRLRLPYEVKTYEITGIPNPTSFYFDINEMRKYALSDFPAYQLTIPASEQITLSPLQYHQQAQANTPHQRLVEHACTCYFDDGDDSNGNPQTPTSALPLGQHGPRGMKFEDYKLALTKPLLQAILDSKFDSATEASLNSEAQSGYWQGAQLLGSAGENQWWMRSGIAGFSPNANFHYYLPEEYTDPFGYKTTLQYDSRDLYVESSKDAKNNTSSIAKFDYRVLTPSEMIDANGNHSEVVFDILGLPVAAAIKGKRINNKWEGDDLSGFNFTLRNPSTQTIQAFCTNTKMDETKAKQWLGEATTRFVYHFGDENGLWNQHMAGASSIMREQHISQLIAGAESPMQVSLECSDGGGNILMKKVQAELDATLPSAQQKPRWIINGLTILNNKGKSVKQFEPYFSDQGFGCELPSEKGVTPIIYYDAAGRTVRTEMPDGTYSRVEFSPWHVKTFDSNDTAYDLDGNDHSDWYNRRTDSSHIRYAEFNTPENTQQNKRAANLVKVHANTPSITIFDSLGHDVIAIAHNRVEDTSGTLKDQFYTTYSKLDAEGKPLWIRDALGHLVMQYINPPKSNNDASNAMPTSAVPCYDIAGNLLFQHSMDAGDRWTINDAAGKPMFNWDVYKANDNAATENRLYSTDYDELHRPTALKLKINNAAKVVLEKFVYQDAQRNPSNNLNGQLVQHYDASGLVEPIAIDFKGSPLEVHRRLVLDAQSTTTDWQGNLASKLSTETFIQLTEYDALARMTRLYNWHRGIGGDVAVIEPEYSERGTLRKETLIVKAERNNSLTGKRYDIKANKTQIILAIQGISYDAKGQRQYLKLGNGTITRYDYDIETYRLKQLRTTRPVYDPTFPKYHADLNNLKVLQQLSYTYDPVGNITEIYDEAYKPAYFQNAIIEPQNLYEYDALYRLIKATGREDGDAIGAPKQIESAPHELTFPVTAANALRKYTQTYQHDAVGNILNMSHVAGLNNIGGWTRHYEYAFDDPIQTVSNRLWRTWQGSGAWGSTTANNKVTYAYDSHGSMLNLADVPVDYRMQWDHSDMIASINLGGGGMAHYQYDAGKQRIRKHIIKNNGNIIEERIYLGGLELYRRNENGVLKEEIETLHLFDGEQRLLMLDQVIKTDNAKLKVGNLYRYTLSNHLGSSTLELNDNAEIISYEEYHPYGTSAYRAGPNAAEVNLKRYSYTGMERDEESGLSYHTARYYLSWLGRWTSADPLSIADGLNLFCYAQNKPNNLIDLDGTQSTSKRETFTWQTIKEDIKKDLTWTKIKEELILGGLVGVRQGFAPLNPLYLTGITKNQIDEQFRQDLVEARAAANAGNFEEAKAIAGGEYMRIHIEGNEVGSSGGEQAAVIIGQATGFNQAVETTTATTRKGDELKGFKRFTTGIDALLRLASTVGFLAGGVQFATNKFRLNTAITPTEKMNAAIARMTAAELRFANISNPELREILIGLEIEGISIPGKVVEVGLNSERIGLVRKCGGAYHDIPSGTTYLNLDIMKQKLAETGLQNPRQVILHEFGHFGQSTNLKLNADGMVDQGAYYGREAAASRTAAKLAKDPADVAALNAHAQASEAVMKLFK
jgi:RHS repeat-associated protein